MNKELNLSEQKGKVFKGYKISSTANQIVLVFKGGTYSTIGIVTDYYDKEDTHLAQEKLKLESFGDENLIECEIISIEELNDLKRMQKEKRDAELLVLKEFEELKELKRLQKKFGPISFYGNYEEE